MEEITSALQYLPCCIRETDILERSSVNRQIVINTEEGDLAAPNAGTAIVRLELLHKTHGNLIAQGFGASPKGSSNV